MTVLKTVAKLGSNGLWRRFLDGSTFAGPNGTLAAIKSAFPGGGGQTGAAFSAFDPDIVLLTCDTSSPRLTQDNFSTGTFILSAGVDDGGTAYKGDGVAMVPSMPGVAFYTSGDPNFSTGGLWVASGLNTSTPGAWKRVDGVAGPALQFNGGNARGPMEPPSPYPRHYGSTIIVDDFTDTDNLLVHVACVPTQSGSGRQDGAWRLKVRRSDLVCVEQIQYGGTAGTYVRAICAPVSEDGMTKDYSRLIISTYNDTAPVKPRLAKNVNDISVGAALPSSSIPNAPTNIEAMAYLKSTTGQPLTIFCRNGGVYFSQNAFIENADLITFTQVVNGPEASQPWISAGGTTLANGNDYAVFVGCYGGTTNGAYRNTGYRGVVSASSTSPATDIVWTSMANKFTRQVNGQVGSDNLLWIDSNTPGASGSAAISDFTTSSADRSRIIVTARGCSYMSRDYGVNWFPVNVFGSANHLAMSCAKKGPLSGMMYTTCGDWTLAVKDPVKPYGKAMASGSNSSGVFVDPRNSEIFVGASSAGGTTAPAVDNGNSLYRVSAAQSTVRDGSLTRANLTDWNLNTGSGVDTNVGQVAGGAVVYGTDGTRCVVVSTQGSQGAWWTVNSGTTWTKILQSSGTVVPFNTGNSDITQEWFWDETRNVIYVCDKGQNCVWRVSVAANGAISTATRIFVSSMAYSNQANSVGYIDLDETNDRLWISTPSNVWYIDNASTATAKLDSSNASATPFSTAYPNEISGPLVFIPKLNAVGVSTLGQTANGSLIYPINGRSGPRFLVVSNPTTSTWLDANVKDWGLTRGRWSEGFDVPHGITRNADGSCIYVSRKGGGVGVWEGH